MKAVIMAGGEGSRLRPLTCNIPKPMARLCGRPIIEYICDLLLRHGVTDAAVTLRYLPHEIISHFEGERYGELSLSFVLEDEPLGTAGSVKNAAGGFEDDFFVISGDAMCDFNLSRALNQHKKSGAAATILAKRVADPREYGLIVTSDQGSVSGFVEKPCFSQAVSDIANTGIYILNPKCLDLIPSGRSFDFAQDLFPHMLANNMPIHVYEDEGYWCDIGDLSTYVSCQRDMLLGRVNCDIHGERDEEGNIFLDGKPKGSYTLEAPVYIGRNVRIGDYAHILMGSVLDDGARVGKASRLMGSVVLENAMVGDRSSLNSAIICSGACVKDKVTMFEGSVLGSRSVLNSGVTVEEDVKIWPLKTVLADTVVSENVKYKNQRPTLFDENGINGTVGVELTPAFCAKIGAAVGSASKKGLIAIACSNNSAAAALKQAVISGLLSSGMDVLDFGKTFLAQFTFAAGECDVPLSLYVEVGTVSSIRLLTADGLSAPRSMERAIEGYLQRGEFRRCSMNEFGELGSFSGYSLLYESALKRAAQGSLKGLSLSVKCADTEIKRTFEEVLYALGCEQGDDLRLHLSEGGKSIAMFSKTAGYIFYDKLLALVCMDEFERGNDVAVPFSAPRALEEIARSYNRQVHRYFDCPADNSDSKIRQLARKQRFTLDALFLTVRLLSYLSTKGMDIKTAVNALPKFEVISRYVPCNSSPGSIMKGLSSQYAQTGGIGEGVRIPYGEAVVLVRPLKCGRGFRLYAEAQNAEIAQEICDGFENTMLSNLT